MTPKKINNSNIVEGHFYSINTIRAKGHKGQLRKRKKNGRGKAVIVTHADKTRKQKNWPLNQNPQKEDRLAFLVTEVEDVIVKKHLGKHHPDMKITDVVDKSKIRHLLKQNKKKG